VTATATVAATVIATATATDAVAVAVTATATATDAVAVAVTATATATDADTAGNIRVPSGCCGCGANSAFGAFGDGTASTTAYGGHRWLSSFTKSLSRTVAGIKPLIERV